MGSILVTLKMANFAQLRIYSSNLLDHSKLKYSNLISYLYKDQIPVGFLVRFN